MAWHQAQFFSASALPWAMSLVALRSRRLGLAQALQAVLGADERGVERERTAEVGGGRLLVPARLIDVAAVVVGERVHGIELDRRAVVGNRLLQIAGLAVSEPAAVQGGCVLGIEAQRHREIDHCLRRVALDELCIAARGEELRGRLAVAGGLRQVGDGAGGVPSARRDSPRPK